jgi:NADPH:quinone reductase-like Zn-dependent oxidoreductase
VQPLPRIAAAFDLADAAEAHRLAETGSAAGRIILTPAAE